MTKKIRWGVRLAVAPISLALLWLVVRLFSVFLTVLLKFGHEDYEAHMAKQLMWPSLAAAGAALAAWYVSKIRRWEFIRLAANECFSVWLSIFLGIVLVFIHARHDWWWYLAAALPAIFIILLDRDDERVWSRAIRFTAVPVITLLAFHFAAVVR